MGNQRHSEKKPITSEMLRSLLGWLDPDPDQAPRKYEVLRLKLIKFFEWNNCHEADEYADKTIDIVASKLAAGEEIRATDRYLYFHGVARNLLREYFKKRARTQPLIDLEKTVAADEPEDSADATERQSVCLEQLNTQDRDLLVCYYSEHALGQPTARRNLAKRQTMSENALRLRVCRLRERLLRCLQNASQ
jgi:DNA-directed RNA polymerase specialized sigma24 family protein